ncbi:MAG: ATPase [Desulfovibrionales bacterium]|nr:MAG: ATPase [Desulfovibrionales bacterium]
MYESFFGLHTKPFDLLPNPDFLYQSKSHKRAMTYLDYGIKARSGFILITGEIGSGKTTIIRDLIKKKLPNVVLSKVFNTKVSSEQLIALINDDFGLPTQGRDKITLLRELNDFLIDQFAQNRQPVLIIDEAQNLSPELLEEVRMLSNLETDQAKLLQIILVGQPELKKVLTSPELLQLRQRININCHIQPLTLEETEQYILHRLERAGDRHAAEFSPDALALVHAQSRGVPRLINIICDFFMLSMFAAEVRAIDGEMAREIVTELDFAQQFWDTDEGSSVRDHGESAAAITSLDNQAESQRTKIKLTTLLKDMNRRIEVLERLTARDTESITLDLVARMDRLEATVRGALPEPDGATSSRIADSVSASALRTPSHAPPEPAQKDGETASAESEAVAAPAKGFFRRLFDR